MDDHHQASKEETMQSNNPVFRRSEEFRRGGNAYGNQMYAGNGTSYRGYGADSGRRPARPTHRPSRPDDHRLRRPEDRRSRWAS